MKLASVPGSRGEGEGGGVWREVGVWGGGLLSETQAASHLGPKPLPLRVLLQPANPGLARCRRTNGNRNFINLRFAEAWIC